MNMKKIISAAICGCFLALMAIVANAAISSNSVLPGTTSTNQNSIYATRWDALVPALQQQVIALTLDMSNMIVKATAANTTNNIIYVAAPITPTTNKVIYLGATTNLSTNTIIYLAAPVTPTTNTVIYTTN